MGLSELLDEIRVVYLEEMMNSIDAVTAEDPALSVVIEPALVDESGETSTSDDSILKLPVRLDLALYRDGALEKLSNVEVHEMIGFEPAEFMWGDELQVHLLPFSWDSLPIRFEPGFAPDWEPLRAWFIRWFQEEEDGGDSDEGDFLGAVHAISDPVSDEQGVVLAIDMGSAPLEAFEELLDVCEALGAQHVLFGDPELAASMEDESEEGSDEDDEIDEEDASDDDQE